MNIVVLLKQVPDLVEELEVDADGKTLDRSWLRFIINEFDDHALEQALLLKERNGGRVRVLALDFGGVDDTLFTALAKGADSAAKITGDFEQGVDSHTAARSFQGLLADDSFDLILTGVQANDDLDGQVGALLASYLNLPYIGVVNGVSVDESTRTATVKKEFPGGVLARMTVQLPAVLGIQAAEQPPRYVPVARIRQAMKTAQIEEIAAADKHAAGAPLLDGGLPVEGLPSGIRIRRMFKPEAGAGAEMITGDADQVINRLIGILSDRGLLR